MRDKKGPRRCLRAVVYRPSPVQKRRSTARFSPPVYPRVHSPPSPVSPLSAPENFNWLLRFLDKHWLQPCFLNCSVVLAHHLSAERAVAGRRVARNCDPRYSRITRRLTAHGGEKISPGARHSIINKDRISVRPLLTTRTTSRTYYNFTRN